MAKTRNVIWTREASERVDSIKKYLKENWSEKEVELFLLKLMRFEKLVPLYPDLYPHSLSNPHLQRAVITKHNSLIYSVKEEEIVILTILDNRQNT